MWAIPDRSLFSHRPYVSDRNAIGRYERVFSDHFDLIAPESFNGKVYTSFSIVNLDNVRLLFLVGVITVAKFIEDDPEQAYIPPHKFYRRYTFEYKARKLQVTLFPPLAILVRIY